MVGAMALAAWITFELMATPSLAFAMIFVSGIAAVIAALSFLWALSHGEKYLAQLTSMSGLLTMDGSELSVRIPGMRERRLRFDVEDPLEIRCASYADDERGDRTYLLVRRGDDVAICTSSGRVNGWAGGLAIERRRFALPPDVPVLELEHAALEEILTSIDDRRERGEPG